MKLVDEEQVLANAAFNNRLGTDQAVKWKGRGSIFWGLDPLTVAFGANYTGPFRCNNGACFKEVSAWTIFDLTAKVAIDNIRPGLTLQGRVTNLFDKDPPFVDLASGYFPALASPFGRQFEITLRFRL